jgi:hypothetical protein
MFLEDKSQNFGKDASGNITGVFMDSYTISGLQVQIKDFEGAVNGGIKNVKLILSHNNDSNLYGGYTGAIFDVVDTRPSIEIELVDTGDGITFAQQGSVTIQHAGSYTTTFSYAIGTGSANEFTGDKLPTNAPVFTVSSIAPTVKITAASYASASSQTASTFTDTSTTVYAYQYETVSTVCGKEFKYKAYKQPFVTMTLSGYGNASGASMTFTATSGGSVLLYEAEEGRAAVNKYSWSGNGTCTRWVGYWNSQTGDDDRTTAGTLNSTGLVLVYDGVEYIVTTPFTINNPN